MSLQTINIAGRSSELLTPQVLDFLVALERRFGERRRELLSARGKRKGFDFLPETASVRSGNWKIAPVPALLQDRRVEITGPTDAKMVINALNSGASVFMADCEDSLSPSWENVIGGQEALFKAVRRTLEFTSPEGKQYK
ncbi:MAG TPA: malate synthase A, partial [Archangium sp.]